MEAGAVLAVLLVLLFLGSILSAVGGLTDLIVETAAGRLTFGLFRQLHSIPTEVVYTAIYLPIFSALGATVSGTGINLMTAGESSGAERLGGLAMIVAAFATLLRLGVQAARGFTRTRGLRRIRSVLSAAPAIDDIPRIRRLRAAGQRLELHGSTISFRGWLAKRSTGFATFAVLTCMNAITVPLAVFFGVSVVRTESEDRTLVLVFLVVAAVSPICYLACTVAAWRTYRSFTGRLGQEIADSAGRALSRLEAARARQRGNGVVPSNERSGLRRSTARLLYGLGDLLSDTGTAERPTTATASTAAPRGGPR
ncbi:hypothetical protein OHA21_12205 [Actinoplanes sp. NBC_00393]|uniref:hypothetical protein n=1 Tax=Actinoplanes sp. NBC_00393 TaxID=2975953 RepID=UPI002E1E79EE